MSTPNHGYSEEELADLTPAEREALDMEGEDPSRTLDDLGDDAIDADTDADDEAARLAAEQAAAAAAATPAPAAADDDDIPLLDATPPEGAQETLEQIAQQKADLRKKYDDGEVSFEEYDAQKDELLKQEREIELALAKANIASEMQQRQAAAEWNKTVKGFMREHPEYQVPADEAARATPEGRAAALRYTTLDQAVRRIAKDNPELSGAEILAAAHNELSQAFGTGTPKKPEPAKSGRERAAADALPTLAQVPAAESSGTDSRYARLDHLMATNPVAYEAELAKMSEADRDAYLNA